MNKGDLLNPFQFILVIPILMPTMSLLNVFKGIYHVSDQPTDVC